MPSADKDPGAFKTIGELSEELGVAQHILRYWETKFPQLRPLQRAGNRRYYRPADVELARRIHHLLSHEGYTVRGVQKLLSGRRGETVATPSPPMLAPDSGVPVVAAPDSEPTSGSVDIERLIELRDRLAAALEE